jgi:hypothetical protein
MPFGDHCQYKKFSDCTKAHSDKDDPAAYCATIQDKTEEHCKRSMRIELRRKVLHVAAIRQAVDDTYEWDEDKHHYLRDGAVVSLATILTLRDQLLDAQYADAIELADALEEDGDLEAWQEAMRDLIQETHSAAYMLGRGGINFTQAAERLALAGIVTAQFEYLRQFAADVQAGKVSIADARNRASQYMSSATYAFSLGFADAYGDELQLPAYPGDGGSKCLMNCRCAWDIEEDTKEWRCYWIATGDDEQCTDCDDRAQLYNPYVQKRVVAAAA